MIFYPHLLKYSSLLLFEIKNWETFDIFPFTYYQFKKTFKDSIESKVSGDLFTIMRYIVLILLARFIYLYRNVDGLKL